jgi:hypothetical protein
VPPLSSRHRCSTQGETSGCSALVTSLLALSVLVLCWPHERHQQKGSLVSNRDIPRDRPRGFLGESFSITGTPNLAAPSSELPQSAAAKPKAKKLVIRHAAAVLTGQSDFLEQVAPCFVSDNAKIRKLGEQWVLESCEFESCETAEQLFSVANDLVSRVHLILALYCNSTPSLVAKYISWTNGEGERWRAIRGSIGVNIISSKGVAELGKMSGTQPLGSAVFQAMNLDPAVKEALGLHGEGELRWSQIYDIIEFLGGIEEIVKAKFASRGATRTVRQTANHHRHLGSTRKFPLPSNPTPLAKGVDFARSLLRRWIASRL